jgi:hypothetical protein
MVNHNTKCKKGATKLNDDKDFCNFINFMAKLISLLAGCGCKK